MKVNFRTSFVIIGLLVATTSLPTVHAAEPDDVIARVGDEIITFNSLDVTINSSAMVGIPIPKPGTRERTNMRLTLLDRRISANILYLDALEKKLDDNQVFKSKVQYYADTILAMMYKQKYLIGELPVSDDAIRKHFKQYYPKDTPFTQDLHLAIEASLRKQQFKNKLANLRDRVRKDVEVKVFEDRLDAAGDSQRKSSTVIAKAGGESITWGQVRQKITMVGQDPGAKARRERLDKFIDSRIMVQKARAVGLEQDSSFQRRLKEFKKSTLVNMHRANIAEKLSPSDDEIREYFKLNKDKIVIRELRKVQMVVLKTEEEAAAVKQKITTGEITFFQAASDYSIDPNAKMNLGELGWVPQGTGFAKLDKVTFALNPNEIGGPVESPAGWHLVQVQDVRDGNFQDIDDRETWKKTRRLLVHEKENNYVINLRKNSFPVKVYEDVFSRLIQNELESMKAQQHEADIKGDS